MCFRRRLLPFKTTYLGLPRPNGCRPTTRMEQGKLVSTEPIMTLQKWRARGTKREREKDIEIVK